MGTKKKIVEVQKAKSSPTQVAPRGAGVDDDASFLAVIWPIDMSISLSSRPMCGLDIESFRARHSLQLVDAIYALCLQNSAKFNEVCRLPSLPYTLELLIRLYDESPGHASWKEVTPQVAFEVLYGAVERDFAGSPLAKEVRLDLYGRFAAALGRSRFAAHRWIQGQGNAKAQISKVFAKLLVLKEPRETLERIARLMWASRRQNFDALHPMPSLKSPPAARRRGPKVGSKRAPRNISSSSAAKPDGKSKFKLGSQS